MNLIEKATDIIIPIYNAFDDFERCLDSIIRYTDLSKNRLILIDDASTDNRIQPYLEKIGTQFYDKNIVVLQHDKNKGFSGSINDGINYANDSDVLILNSDTIVTKNWLAKIKSCAYSDCTIATVTPLSNNATLCSIPEFCQENQLPEGYTLNEFAQLIEERSLHLYPVIPVGNGFCMFIKREVIDSVGLFDEETFQRGYGEETDFCYRAEQIGYHHVMCDDTYIYHSGSVSFLSEEKKKYIYEHERIVNERYPIQNKRVAQHCSENPNSNIQENIKLWLTLKNKKKNILYLVQSDFRADSNDHLGGTQIHVKDMCQISREEYNIFVAARNLDFLNLTAYIGGQEFLFKFFIGMPEAFEKFRDKKFALLYRNILTTFSIDLVHIHHTKNLTLELYYEANKRNIPIITTLHDYYTICPKITMVTPKNELCIGKDTVVQCQDCLSEKGIYRDTNYIELWRNHQKNALDFSSKIVVPSDSTKKIIIKYYPQFSSKVVVIEHGIPDLYFGTVQPHNSKEFHVAFIGGINAEKGSRVSYELIKNGPSDIMWYLFGVWGYNELSLLDKKNYTKTGLYEREELPGLLDRYCIDIVCILPILSETYCYTLSEAVARGIPVIATDIGALGDRVKSMNCGWLVSPQNTYTETLDIIKRIKNKGTEYQKMQKHLSQIHVRNLSEMGSDYLRLYGDYTKGKVSSENLPGQKELLWALDGYLTAQGKHICWEANGEIMQSRLESVSRQLTAVTNSFTYKCVKELENIRIPGKKHIKKLLFNVYKIVKHQ